MMTLQGFFFMLHFIQLSRSTEMLLQFLSDQKPKSLWEADTLRSSDFDWNYIFLNIFTLCLLLTF